MIFLTHATIVTGTEVRKGTVGIDGGRITGVWYDDGETVPEGLDHPRARVIPLDGLTLMAGGIDAHVHFREPGLTHKADMASESAAALLGGVTSVIDMPNTVPPTVSRERLAEKAALARGRFRTHYGFHIGATADNADELAEAVRSGEAAGIKVFLGSSTGNMLVGEEAALERIFRIPDCEILVHSEDEDLIRRNLQEAQERYGDDIPFSAHPEIRSRRACILSTAKALERAIRCGTRLHVLHVSTAEEIEMIRAARIHNPQITAETSANYLWFCDRDYDRLGGRLKCNPAVKSERDRAALRKALADGLIDTIGSDHAPHLAEEKDRPYLQCPSGVPSIQQSLPVLLTVAREEGIPLSRIARAFSERPAELFGLRDRGRIAPGCRADLVVVDPEAAWTVGPSAYRCGWSPYEGEKLTGAVKMVFLDGELAVRDGRLLQETPAGTPLQRS